MSLEFLELLDELLPAIQRVGGYFHVKLNELAAKHAVVKEVRGFGLMLGMELTIPGKQIVLDGMSEGLLFTARTSMCCASSRPTLQPSAR